MQARDYSPAKKALEINLDDSIYGTFAEIGAGQEVARHFFLAGRASHTIAKSMSAYDMTFSDAIYGKDSRYVCESRVLKMLEHEYDLLLERLGPARRDKTRFFAFADTVATGSDTSRRPHGWLGIRYQTKPGGAFNDVVLHVQLWDRFRLQQQETLGILGVNLIHMAFFPPQEARDRIAMLAENLSTNRIEVNLIRFSGPDLQHLDNRLLNLELVKQGLTEAVLFDRDGKILHAGDELFRQSVLVQRGTYRPITTANLQTLEKTRKQFVADSTLNPIDPKVLFEITYNSLTADHGLVDDEDFLNRVDTLASLKHEVLISNFQLFYQLKAYIRQYSQEALGIVVGASLLPKMFDPMFYVGLTGGIMEGMSRLFDEKTRVYVIPHKTDKTCETTKTLRLDKTLNHLYQHLLSNHWLVDALECDDIDTTVHSDDVRKMLEQGNPEWKKHVPDSVRKLIEEQQLFGYRP